MRKFAKVFVALIVFLTLFSMGVQQVASFATMGSGPMNQRGIEALPVWARWAVGGVGLVIAVGGARKMLLSSGAERTGRREGGKN